MSLSTSYRVTSAAGALLGVFPKGQLAAVRELVADNPGSEVVPVVTIDNPCAAHPSHETDNCPRCGTSRMTT